MRAGMVVAMGFVATGVFAQPVAPTPLAPKVPETEATVAAGDAVATVPGEGRAYARRQMACDEVRLTYTIGTGPESSLLVKNEAGTTGLRFIVDRTSGRTLGIQVWRKLGGLDVTSLPANARIDWIDCQDAEPIGGIAVEWVDASTLND